MQLPGRRVQFLRKPCRRVEIPSLYQVIVKLHLVGIGVDSFLLQVYFVALGDNQLLSLVEALRHGKVFGSAHTAFGP